MSKTNKRKSEQLGMPFGTACNRLRKILMFHMSQKLEEDICYKCKKKIKTIKEFTIEHKEPWLDVSADLFWNLENIAFSHSRCNNADRPWQKPLWIHGTSSTYGRGCKCDECRRHNTERRRKIRARLVE